jgi:hypothetical protein
VTALTGIDVDVVFFDAAAARDQFNDAADITADIPDIGSRKSILEIPTDELLIPEADDLKIIVAVPFEVLFRSRSRTVQFVL